MNLPDEAIQKLIEFARENDLGMGQLSDGTFTVVVIGPKQYNINESSIISAHMLLTGVITGESATADSETKKTNKTLN